MTKLFNFELEIWYRHGNFEKDFMNRTIVAESPEKAIELANLMRNNIFKVDILKKEVYHERKL